MRPTEPSASASIEPRPAGHIRRRGFLCQIYFVPLISFCFNNQAAAAPPIPGRLTWNSVPSVQSRCRMTARRRATAICARRMPRRCATCIPHRLSQFQDRTRHSNTVAASHSRERTIRSPHRVILPVRSVSPEAYLRGVRPKCDPSNDAFLNRRGSSTAVRYASAVTGPTLGTLTSRQQTGPEFATARSCRCKSASRAVTLYRTRRTASAISSRTAMSETSSRTRSSKRPTATRPTFSRRASE